MEHDMTTAELCEVAKSKGRPKSGRDDVTAKIDRGLMMKAKIVASAKKITLAEYLSETLQAHVERDWTKVIRKIDEKGTKGD